MSISQAVEKRDSSPAGMIQQYKGDFALMLPSHVNADQWSRVAIGALRRDPKLAQAAANDIGAFMAALSNAARLGLEAGTEQFYLTPRRDRGVEKVLGIVGWQGLVELMYRAGAISSVVAEVVHQSDTFSYAPGRDEKPVHEIDWDAANRGPLRLVYAYAVMKDGATSKVVVLNRAQIETIKKSSQGADSAYSPWKNHEPAMWLKSAVRQLAKWVPTSAEFRREQLRAAMDVAAEADRIAPLVMPEATRIPVTAPTLGDNEHIDPVTGEVSNEPIDAEIVTDGEWPAIAQPGGAA